jgi:hypothetical protein
MKRVVLRIDRLSLRGVAPSQVRELSTTLSEELTRSLSEGTVAPGTWPPSSVERIAVGSVPMSQGSGGRRVAVAVAGALRRRLAP